MRRVLTTALFAGVCAMPALAQQAASPVTSSATTTPPAQANTNPTCYGTWSAMPAAERARTTYQAYVAKCGDAPVSSAPLPQGATAQCTDGTVSIKPIATACAKHGGIAKHL